MPCAGDDDVLAVLGEIWTTIPVFEIAPETDPIFELFVIDGIIIAVADTSDTGKLDLCKIVIVSIDEEFNLASVGVI